MASNSVRAVPISVRLSPADLARLGAIQMQLEARGRTLTRTDIVRRLIGDGIARLESKLGTAAKEETKE